MKTHFNTLVKQVCVVFVIFTFVMCTLPQFATAQELALSINPPLIEAAIKPGKSIVIAFTIANLGDPMIVSTDVSTFQPHGIDGAIKLTGTKDSPIRFDLENSDLKIGKPFFLRNGKGQQMLLKIRVPEGTPEGDYYFTYYVQNELGRAPEGIPSARSQARIGANILLTVTSTGNVDVVGGIGYLKTNPRFTLRLGGKEYAIFESTDPIPVDLVLQNTGTSMIKPQGSLQLRGTFGEEAEFSLMPQNILSSSSRRIHASSSAEISAEDRARIGDASLILKRFFVGSYSIVADVSFGDESKATKATTGFIAIPYKLILASIFVAACSLIALKKFRQDIN